MQTDKAERAGHLLGPGRLKEVKAAVPELFGGLPIALSPVYSATHPESTASASWMAALANEPASSNHIEMAREAKRAQGILPFAAGDRIGSAGEPTWLITEELENLGATWALFRDGSAALVRLLGEDSAEAFLHPMILRPVRRTDIQDKISVCVPREPRGDLRLKTDHIGLYMTDPFGMFGTAIGATPQGALDVARERLHESADPELAETTRKVMAIWTRGMELAAGHILDAWGEVVDAMPAPDLSKVRPAMLPQPVAAHSSNAPGPRTGPACFRRMYLENVYWLDTAGQENTPPKAFPCKGGSTAVNVDIDRRQPVVTVRGDGPDVDVQINLAPDEAWIFQPRGKVSITLKPTGELRVEMLDQIEPLAEISTSGRLTRELPGGRLLLVDADGDICVTLGGGRCAMIMADGSLHVLEMSDNGD